MTNGEKYEDFIKKHVKSGDAFGIVNNIPKECEEINCPECLLYSDAYYFCDDEILKFYSWLTAEYKEPIKLTLREHNFCKMVKNGFFVRDKEENLWYFEEEPERDRYLNWTLEDENVTQYLICFSDEASNFFPFINFNSRPFSVKELLSYEIK